MASDPTTSWEIDGETVETVSDFVFLETNIMCQILFNLRKRKLLEVMDMSVTLAVVMVSRVYASVQTHQIVYIK